MASWRLRRATPSHLLCKQLTRNLAWRVCRLAHQPGGTGGEEITGNRPEMNQHGLRGNREQRGSYFCITKMSNFLFKVGCSKYKILINP